jgi:hypothetical protein
MLSELALLLLLDVPRTLPPSPAPPPPAPGLVLERVVAVIDERPVLLSEVHLLVAVKGLTEDAAREALVDELLMQREAARLPGTRAAPELEAQAVADLRARAPKAPLPALERLAARQLAILAYVEQRFRPLVRVEEDTVQAALDLAMPEPAARPEGAAARVREELEDAQLGRLVEEWIKELRDGARVRQVP